MKTIKKINKQVDKFRVRMYLSRFTDFNTAELSVKETYIVKAQQRKSDASMFFALSTLFLIGAFGIKMLITV
jgi:hypothetical protein